MSAQKPAAAVSLPDYAVQISSLCKRYGKSCVLKGLSLQVPMGKIYGLLGPSGCGKTTLLKCMVGRIQPDSGFIRVMGRRPGQLGHQVPGHLIGFMPQDLALYPDFTICEILYYFGRIFGMRSGLIDSRVSFLSSLLSLPEMNKLIGQLSGGQQRRVSFACALLHRPPLLILDEPTVGVDPMLRQCIWYHLRTLVSCPDQPTSVIITTHYIEEARQGDLVGLMRDGSLLAESNPLSLLRLYKETSLESVFLMLCRQTSQTADECRGEVKFKATRDSRTLGESARALLMSPPSPRRVLAVVAKDANTMRRRLGFLMFQFTLPMLQIVLFCVCIGGEPKQLKLAVVNLDHKGGLGDKFLRFLDNTTFEKTQYPDIESARTQVLTAQSWALVHLSGNFTSSLLKRPLSPLLKNSSRPVPDGTVQLEMDNSNYQVGNMILKSVTEACQKFIARLLEDHGFNPNLASLPVTVRPPLLGSKNASFTEFMAPGMIVTIVFFMATGHTALTFVLERREGLIDRSLAAGVTVAELLLGHMVTELAVMLCQTATLLLACTLVFHIPCHGSVALAGLLALASGVTGMSLGMLVSALCSTENSAIQASLGTVYPNLLLGGIIWPVEAMPRWLRLISRFLPCSMSVEGMRSVMSRGFGIASDPVWHGLVASLLWSGGLLLLAVVVLKIRGL